MVNFSEEFAAGVPFMDASTRRFVSELNKLSDAMKNGEGREYTIFALDYVRDYAKNHLALEKKVMLQYEFYELEGHCKQHEDFLTEIESMVKAYEERGADHSMPLSLQRLMSGWLIKHISRSDRVLGDFLIARSGIRKA